MSIEIINKQNTLAEKSQRLKEIIIDKSLKRGDFILASGARSDYLFDLKPTMLDPEGANLIGELMLEKLEQDITAVGGLELGACPAVSNICVISYQKQREIKAFYVRKEKKGRGSNNLIEGAELIAGDKVVIIEDVTTTGGSSQKAIDIVRALGCEVVKVLSIVDRLQGAAANLAAKGVKLDALFTKDELL